MIKNINGVNVNEGSEIEWMILSNCKRVGSKSWGRMEMYLGSKTVGEYLKKGGWIEDLRYDEKKGFLKVVGLSKKEVLKEVNK